jgi:hypothetical protein
MGSEQNEQSARHPRAPGVARVTTRVAMRAAWCEKSASSKRLALAGASVLSWQVQQAPAWLNSWG